MTRGHLVGIALVALVALRAAPASAGPDEVAAAEQTFRDGIDLMDDGKFKEACEAFETSQQLDPAVNTLANLANCREKNGQLATAWVLFLELERQTRGAKKRELKDLNKVANKRANNIQPKLSYMTISVPDESRIEGLLIKRNGEVIESSLWNRAIPIDGGDYTVSGEAPGHEPWETHVFVATEKAKVTVDVPKFKEAAKLVEETQPEEKKPEEKKVAEEKPVDVEDRMPAPEPSPGMFTTQRKIAVGVGVLGVAGVAAAFVLGGKATDLEDQAHDLCPTQVCPGMSDQANGLLDDARAKAFQANIALGVGAAAVVGAAVLWFTGGPSGGGGEKTLAVTPHVSPTQAGLDLAVRF